MPKDQKIRKRVVVEEIQDNKTVPEITAPEKLTVPQSELEKSLNSEAKQQLETTAEPLAQNTTPDVNPVTNTQPDAPQQPVVSEVQPKTESVIPPTLPPETNTVSTASVSVEPPNQTDSSPDDSLTTFADPDVKIPDSTAPNPNEPVPEIIDSSGPSPLVIIIPGIFLLGALLGGIYFYQKNLNNTDKTPISTPTPTANIETGPIASASPSSAIDLSKFSINIMNGSGIVGEAAKVKTLLEGAGFKVSATGNASSYDFTKTIVKAKTDIPSEFIKQLTDLLSKNYVLDTNQVLATSSADKVQIVVGSSKAK